MSLQHVALLSVSGRLHLGLRAARGQHRRRCRSHTLLYCLFLVGCISVSAPPGGSTDADVAPTRCSTVCFWSVASRSPRRQGAAPAQMDRRHRPLPTPPHNNNNSWKQPKMAAATMAGLSAQRMEKIKFEYFSSINSMARKIMQERERIKARHGPTWEKMTPQEQENAIDSGIVDPHIRARYAMHRIDREDVDCYPKLKIETGQKIVHFGEEDITWQDEHSAPFSWETKSQLEFSLSGSADQGVPTLQADPKPARVTPTPKVSVSEARKPEEESSFWKISAERSKLEREQPDFQSLTPSQIKSLEKGEKPLPSYLRQESEPADPPAPAKSTKQRAPKPPAPQPPPASAVSATPASISITPSAAPPASEPAASGGWERSQSTLPSVSNTLDEMFSSNVLAKPPSTPTYLEKEKNEEGLPSSPSFSQFNTSSNILKTGFDFLDNW